MQELLDKLRANGTGCYIGDTFLGVVAWADDFLLTAPTRGAMQFMLDTCSLFASVVGLQFSTDPNPVKSGKALPYVALLPILAMSCTRRATCPWTPQ